MDSPFPHVKIIGPLAYQGKPDCEGTMCTSMPRDDGTRECIGWHCSYCDAPCSSQGHKCEVGDTMLAEARRVMVENGELPSSDTNVSEPE